LTYLINNTLQMASLKRTSNHGGISKVIAHNDGESEIELICSVNELCEFLQMSSKFN